MTHPQERPAGTFHILSLSGGGYLGLYTAIILADLERRLGRPIATAFDLIAGTSIGGLLALALGLEVPADRLVRELQSRGTTIFSRRPKPKTVIGKRLDMFRYLLSPKYRSDELVDALDAIYAGQPTMADIPRHRVVVPAVNLTKGAAQVLKTPHHAKYERDSRLLVRDVALATSAAPTVFPIAAIDDQLYTDGGLFAQSPDLVAIHEAEHYLGVAPENVRMLSIGTTTSRFSIPAEEGTGFGLLNWAFNQRLWSAIISSQQQIVEYMSRYLLEDRYVRIDAVQSEADKTELAIDVATSDAQSVISRLAERSIANAGDQFGAFVDHQAPEATFYHGPYAGLHHRAD